MYVCMYSRVSSSLKYCFVLYCINLLKKKMLTLICINILCCKCNFQFGNKSCCYYYSVIVSQKIIIIEFDQNAIGIPICMAQAHQLYKLGMSVSLECHCNHRKAAWF